MNRLFLRGMSAALLACSILFLVFAPTRAASPCDDHYFYADERVAWCAPEGWKLWSSYTDIKLDSVLNTMYGLTTADVYNLGMPIMAMQMHTVVDKFAVYVQVFVTDYSAQNRSPEDFVDGLYLDGSSGKITFERQTINDRPVGVAYQAYQIKGYARQWVVYPFEDLGKTYFVVAFAPLSAWNDLVLGSELSEISKSLFVAEKPRTQSVNQDQMQTSGSDHPMWFGGRILDIQSESGKGSVSKTFEGGTWEFFSDSTVVFTPVGIGTNLRDDLFPVSGTYSTNGSNVTFSQGVYQISGGTISFTLKRSVQLASVLISGDIDVDSGIVSAHYLVQSSIVDSINKTSLLLKYEAQFTEQLTQQAR